MNESEVELGENAVYRIQGDWDVDTVTEQIFVELNGTAARSTIQEVIKDVFPKYEGAPVQTFVPIFIRRDAVDKLKAMQALFSTPVKALVDSEIKQEEATQEAVEALVAADLVEEAVADNLAATVLTADMNETVTE